MTCPWDQYTPSTLAFCEEKLCAYVAQPSNAYSCMAFVLLGAALIWKHRAPAERAFAAIGVASIAVGLLSFVYHATNVLWGELLDLGSMYWLTAVMIGLNRRLNKGLSARGLVQLVLGVVAASFALLALEPRLGIPVFAVHLGLALWGHLIYVRGRTGVDFKFLKLLLLTFAVSFGAWLLDVTRLSCDPTNHVINGHTVWHLLNATCIWLYYRHMRQFAAKLVTA